MAKIYGNPITFGGGTGGQNADLPPLLDNFKAYVGTTPPKPETITLADVPVSDAETETIVNLKESDGKLHPYLYLSNNYESSGAGLLLRKECYHSGNFSTGSNVFSNSTYDIWCNNTFVEVLDNQVRSKIVEVNIPTVSSTKIMRKCFPLSLAEYNLTGAFDPEGKSLSYFSTSGRRTSILNDSPETYWTRTGGIAGAAYSITSTGDRGTGIVNTNTYAYRPAFCLPLTFKIKSIPNEDGSYDMYEGQAIQTLSETDGVITIAADKMLESRAKELAGAVWVYGDHEPESVNDGTKIQLTREEIIRTSSSQISVLSSSGFQPILNLNVRDKLKLGTYDGKSLKWIIAHKLNNKIYLALESDSVKAIGTFMFDQAEPSNPDNARKTKGNNRYIYSNVHQWLNSTKPANEWFTAQHSYDIAPPYATTQNGFLYEWSEKDLNVLETTRWEVTKAAVDGGDMETFSAKIALPSTTEYGTAEGKGGFQFDLFQSDSDRNTTLWMLSRTPMESNSYSMTGISPGGAGGYSTECTNPGVAYQPCCVIDGANIYISESPDDDGCYVIVEGGEFVSRTLAWSKTKDFYARQFTYNSKKQYQTMLEGALASVIVEGAPAQVTDLVVSGSGGTATLTWVNPVDDPVYAETVVVQKVGSAPSDITDGTEIYRGTDQTCTATGLEQSTDYYFAVYTVSGLGVYKQPVVSDVYSYDFPAEPTDYLDCAEISETTEYEIPENGWFRIDAIAKSGNGGYTVQQTGNLVVTPGGGGTGGYSRSEIAANKGDIISIEIQSGNITISSETIENLNMSSSHGTDGIAAETPNDDSYGGSGGTANGGNKINETGLTGNAGKRGRIQPGETYPGGSGAAKSIEINSSKIYHIAGGRGRGIKRSSGGGSYSYISNTTGTAAIVFISRGNTNTPSPSTASTLSLLPTDSTLTVDWTNSGDPVQTGTMLVYNTNHVPTSASDGVSVDIPVAQTTVATFAVDGEEQTGGH